MSAPCTAERFGYHDYSQPPHTTPEQPVPARADKDCQTQTSRLQPCEHDQRYRIVVYQPGTHEWIELLCCEPCTASLRYSARQHGPGGTNGVYSVSPCPRSAVADTPQRDAEEDS